VVFTRRGAHSQFYSQHTYIHVHTDTDDEAAGPSGNGNAAAAAKGGGAGALAAAVKQEPPDEPADAVTAFKQLLYDKGVSSTVKWGEVSKALAKEPLWGSLKTGEKKQAFAEYQTKRMKEEREEKRLKTRKAKDGFLKLLAETVEIDSKSRWREAQELLKDDARFKAPELSEHDKEDIFGEFVTELAKREKEEKAINKQAFLELLKSFAGEGKITRETAWREAQALLEELPGAEEQRLLDLVDDVDRRHAFEDLQLELEAAHRERKRREKEERKRLEEERRQAFKARLAALEEEGTIDMDSRWKVRADVLVWIGVDWCGVVWVPRSFGIHARLLMSSSSSRRRRLVFCVLTTNSRHHTTSQSNPTQHDPGAQADAGGGGDVRGHGGAGGRNARGALRQVCGRAAGPLLGGQAPPQGLPPARHARGPRVDLRRLC
jgi:hypothetical protein